MSIANSGGPAFPSGARIEDDSGKGYHIEQAAWMGMSLRDYFAGQALIGLLSNPGKIADPDGNILQRNPSTMAGMAYEIADEMLKVREL